MSRMPKEPVKLVPVPSTNKIPERDIDKSPILECRHLGIDFGGLAAVKDFNMAIGRTEIAGLIGPNGAGKTTVFNLLTKVYQPTRGTILVDGVDTHNMNTVQVNKAGIARTFQNIRLFSNLSVEDNVKLGLHNHINYNMWSGILRLPRYWNAERLAHERAMELLSIFDMGYLAKYKAGSLPYGDQRKLEIVRALATNPSLLLLDEPINGLDPEGIVEFRNLLLRLNQERQTTILISSHILSELANLATCYGFLDNGMMLEQISARALEEKCRACIEARVDNASRAALVLEQSLGIRDYEVLPGHLLRIYSSLDAPYRVAQALVEGGVALQSIESRGANLEDYFLSMIGGVRHA